MASFKKAFAEAREAKRQTFEWNGKKYSTKLKGEDDKGMRTTKPKKRPTQTTPASSPRPQPKARLLISGESPRAPKSSPKPKARADRGSGAVTRSARPAAKPTRVAKDAKPQAEAPTAVKTSVPSGKPTTQKSAPGKANFFSFFKGMAKGRGGLSDKKQGLKQKRGGLSDK